MSFDPKTIRNGDAVTAGLKTSRHLDALTQAAIRLSLEHIEEALFIRYGATGHAVSIEERGWLIEWPPSPDAQPKWWHPERGWTVDASRAIRYARKDDAQAAIATGRFVGGVFASEHSWLSPSTGGGVDD